MHYLLTIVTILSSSHRFQPKEPEPVRRESVRQPTPEPVESDEEEVEAEEEEEGENSLTTLEVSAAAFSSNC